MRYYNLRQLAWALSRESQISRFPRHLQRYEGSDWKAIRRSERWKLYQDERIEVHIRRWNCFRFENLHQTPRQWLHYRVVHGRLNDSDRFPVRVFTSSTATNRNVIEIPPGELHCTLNPSTTTEAVSIHVYTKT